MIMVDTICLRCGYPHRVPRLFRDKIKTCHQCRTPEENLKRLAAVETLAIKSGLSLFRYSKYSLFARAFALLKGRIPSPEELQVVMKLKKGFPDD